MKTTDEIKQAVHATMQATFDDLKRLVRIPSIANGILPRDKVLEAANETKNILQSAGLQQVRLLELGGGYPAVYGEIAGPPGAPTILLYAHYDVQLAAPENAWKTPPFELTAKDGRLYGRGAADDKSGVVAHAATLRVFQGKPPVGIKVIIEGEEEFGHSLESYVEQHPDLFQADTIVVADLGNLKVGEPVLTTTLRGSVALTLEVRTLQGRLHSGNFGGPVPDALIALSKMIATLHDSKGNVAVEGMRRIDWKGADMPENLFRQVAGLLSRVELIGDGSLASRLWTGYSINVIGMDVPSVKDSANVLLDMARARISVRVPPGQDPDSALDMLTHHLEKNTPWHAQVKFTDRSSGAGYAARTDGPAYKAARQAMSEAYGKEASMAGTGGSIPLINVLAQTIPQAEIIIWGAEDLEARIHAPNESVDPQELERVVLQQALFLNEYNKVQIPASTKAAKNRL